MAGSSGDAASGVLDGGTGGGPGRPTAIEIARALGQPDPTAEQQAVIEAPLAPLLVVAGAGSGKTETMAARVVWLVAGGDVSPDGVLGLTFTRKAAAELADRIRRRLRRLRSSGLWAPSGGDLLVTSGDRSDDPGDVEVSTYHSYAGRIVREHGLRLGIEPESRLLSEAACWQLAAQVVEGWDGPMDVVDSRPSTVIAAVLELAGGCAEHLRDPQEIDRWLADRIMAIEALPYNEKKSHGQYAPVRDLVRRLQARRQILPLVEAYRAAKRMRDSVDFGDQLALAAALATTVPALVSTERQRYQAVLLDEFQDTSHAQLTMLHALFGGGHPVTAVGDPHQSIYGWRGASAGTLTRFAARFTTQDGRPALTVPLSTSWRNDRAVLEAANVVADPLRDSRSVPVPRLVARPGAGAGQVEVRTSSTVEDEADLVADWMATRWWTPQTTPQTTPSQSPQSPQPPRGLQRSGRTAAVLCRKRAQFEALEAAMSARGLPVEVVGLGGLLSTPAVADLVATLHVVHDPSRGDQLMRLLTGPGVRLGPRDLVALGSWSRELERRRRPSSSSPSSSSPSSPSSTHRSHGSSAPGSAPEPPVVQPGGSVPAMVADPVDDASLVEALDDLPTGDWHDGDGRCLSVLAGGRLRRLSATLRALRSRTALPLPELVDEVERALLLDVEVAARPGADPASARADLDAFADVADHFSTAADRPTLGAFLAWLDAAQEHERGLEPGTVEADRDAVQLLTVHAAKGLEWDVVAVPGLVEGVLPARSATPAFGPDGWTLAPAKDWGWIGGHGALPHALRGDRDSLPDLPWSSIATQEDLRDELVVFQLAGGEHELAEERRLAYVAFTRARQSLLLCAHVWGDGSRPRLPSRFLTEVAAGTGGLQVDLPADASVSNPRSALSVTRGWPYDPLGDRRPPVRRGADRVLAAVTALAGSGLPQDMMDGPDPEGWAWEVDALLAERDAGRDRSLVVDLPTHLSASRLVRAADDPAALALQIRRPVPHEPRPETRQGTAFHRWVERHLGGSAMLDLVDLPGAADEDPAADDRLEDLKQKFLASQWAGRRAVAIEAAVETPVDGTVIRGRIDAVLERPGGGVDVVDWKTGTPPGGDRAAARAVQLAAYRLAWSRLHDIPVDQVGAAFFYVATGQTERPVDLLDEQGLIGLLRGLGESVSALE